MHNTDTTGKEQVTGDVTFLTVHAAAVRLGVSTRAIRARIKRGTLNAVKVEGSRGMEWRVNLDRTGEVTPTPDAIPTTPTGWVAERMALLDEVAWLRRQVETLQDQTLDLLRLVETAQSANARPLAALPSVESKRRPWFRFW